MYNTVNTFRYLSQGNFDFFLKSLMDGLGDLLYCFFILFFSQIASMEIEKIHPQTPDRMDITTSPISLKYHGHV